MLLKLNSCESDATGYRREQDEVTNFLVYLEKVSIKLPEEERIYTLKVLVDGNKEYLLNVPAIFLNNRGIRSKIPTAVYIEDIKGFNRDFQKTLVSAMKDMDIRWREIQYSAFQTEL